jgi:hypothetical protein
MHAYYGCIQSDDVVVVRDFFAVSRGVAGTVTQRTQYNFHNEPLL